MNKYVKFDYIDEAVYGLYLIRRCKGSFSEHREEHFSGVAVDAADLSTYASSWEGE
jgi:hypothetical protein